MYTTFPWALRKEYVKLKNGKIWLWRNVLYISWSVTKILVHCSLAIPRVQHSDLFLLVREGRMKGTSRKTSERINGQSKEQQLIHSCKVSGALWNRNYEEGPASWQSTATVATIWNYKKQNSPPLNYLHKHSVAHVNVQKKFFLLYFIFICIDSMYCSASRAEGSIMSDKN